MSSGDTKKWAAAEQPDTETKKVRSEDPGEMLGHP